MITERKPSTNGEPLTVQQRIEALQRRRPANPDFVQSTIEYGNECIAVTSERVEDVLTRQFPGTRDLVTRRLQEIVTSYRDLPKTSIIIENSGKFLEFPNNSRMYLNRLAEAVYNANPTLGVFPYIVALYPTKDPRYSRQRYPWFNNRLTKTVEIGELTLDDPRVAYPAVGYVTQVGKAFLTTKSREILGKAGTFAGVDTVERVGPFLDRISESVMQIRLDQTYIATGLATMHKITQEGNLDSLQAQLLLDIAFIRNTAFDQPKEFKQVLEPLIRLMAAGDWNEAFTHRDFLLNYFCSSFPAWRGRAYSESGEVTFDSFKDLARSVASGQLIIHDDQVPSEYRESFGNIFPKKVERVQHEREAEIIRNSVGLTNLAISEFAGLSGNTSMKVAHNRRFRVYADEVRTILLSPTLDEEERFRQFFALMMHINPKLKQENIEILYKSTKSKFTRAFIESSRSPYVVRTPTEKHVLGVELIDNKQVCWYKTDHTMEVKLKSGEMVVRSKKGMNAGNLMHSIILAAYHETTSRPSLTLSEAKLGLQRAYQSEMKRNPAIAQFTIGEYLRALLNSTKFSVKLEDDDPVIRFAKDLDK